MGRTSRFAGMAQSLAKAVLGPPVRRGFPMRVEGVENVPSHGPAVLAPNHLSWTDSVFLALATPRSITFIAKAEYFEDWRTAWIMRSTGQIALRRGHGHAARRALDAAAAVLDGGGLIGIFPEGTRSRDGRLHRGNTGPARLAFATGAPIVPVGLVGTEAVHAPGEPMVHPFRSVTVRYGAPHLVDGEVTAAALLDRTESLMRAIAGLSGQQYVGRRRQSAAA
jgi:1-acyl-sn-glycerol-3-phosphate acyltransferase